MQIYLNLKKKKNFFLIILNKVRFNQNKQKKILVSIDRKQKKK
jgi:hypothetical protein